MKVFSKLTILLAYLALASCGKSDDGPYAKDYDMYNTAKPTPNLVTGGQPSPKDLAKLAQEGIEIVINLRAKEEMDGFDEKALVESLGMEYVAIEMEGSEDITPETAKLLDQVLSQGKKTLLHCASSNRVGGLLAYRAYSIQGQSTEEALDFGKRTGMGSSEKRVRKLIFGKKN